MSLPSQTASGLAVCGSVVVDVAERDEVRREVRQLDADRLLARDRREDADLGRRERVREVVLECGDLRHLRAGRELELVARDARAGDLADHVRLDAEVRERLHEQVGDARRGLLRGAGDLRRDVEDGRVGELVLRVLARDVVEERRLLRRRAAAATRSLRRARAERARAARAPGRRAAGRRRRRPGRPPRRSPASARGRRGSRAQAAARRAPATARGPSRARRGGCARARRRGGRCGPSGAGSPRATRRRGAGSRRAGAGCRGSSSRSPRSRRRPLRRAASRGSRPGRGRARSSDRRRARRGPSGTDARRRARSWPPSAARARRAPPASRTRRRRSPNGARRRARGPRSRRSSRRRGCSPRNAPSATHPSPQSSGCWRLRGFWVFRLVFLTRLGTLGRSFVFRLRRGMRPSFARAGCVPPTRGTTSAHEHPVVRRRRVGEQLGPRVLPDRALEDEQLPERVRLRGRRRRGRGA